MIYDFMTAMDVMRITVFKRKFLHGPVIRWNSGKHRVLTPWIRFLL